LILAQTGYDRKFNIETQACFCLFDEKPFRPPGGRKSKRSTAETSSHLLCGWLLTFCKNAGACIGNTLRSNISQEGLLLWIYSAACGRSDGHLCGIASDPNAGSRVRPVAADTALSGWYASRLVDTCFQDLMLQIGARQPG
jgi:hypothetical protein